MRCDKAAICLLLIGLVTSSCATLRGSPDALADIGPGQRPALESDEAGFWMVLDRMEANLRTSGRVMTDPALNTYIRDMVCKLAGPHCSDIRIYIVQTPHFNATMAPNGAMQVWTGLILRAQNEAQLAYVLGHEIGHYLRRHSLQQWRNIRSTSNVLVVFQVLTAAAGVGYAGSLAQLAFYANMFAYSRDNEREADDVGFELMVDAGYDPREASRIWEALLKEREAASEKEPSIFFASHPPTAERIETLNRLAGQSMIQTKPATAGTERYLAATLALRATFLDDELNRREFAQTQVLLDRLIEGGTGLGELFFFQGELYRLRANEGDAAKAIAAYQKALEFKDSPAEAHRALGILFSKAGEKVRGRSAYERYLENRPDADDREMVQAYLDELD